MAGPRSHGVKHLRGGAKPCGDETQLGMVNGIVSDESTEFPQIFFARISGKG